MDVFYAVIIEKNVVPFHALCLWD